MLSKRVVFMVILGLMNCGKSGALGSVTGILIY